jgi:hypothetical protein
MLNPPIMRRLVRYNRAIHAQEAALEGQRRTVAERYHGFKAHYHRRLSSPTALMTSFATGLVVGILAGRSRRRTKSEVKSVRRRITPWLGLARTIGGRALIPFLSTKAVELVGTSK